MNPVLKNMSGVKVRANEGLNLGAAITVLLILLLFIAASFYILISSYLEIN
jgi:heme/copper-type cytochrome/quinol oxidase subunit 4